MILCGMRYVCDSSVSSLFHPDRMKPLTMIEQVPMEGYLHETFSSSAQDSSQAEGERIQGAFQSESYWTLQKLPDCFEPGSIQNKNKLQTMTNLFGTGMPEGPVAKRIDNSSSIKPSNLFGTQEYIATDYNKKSDIRKANLENERNLNASFSRKPFKTLSYTRHAPSETYNFNIKKKIKAEDNTGSSGLDDNENRLLESTYSTSFVPDLNRSIVDSRLRKVRRNIYSTDEKEKILRKHLHSQSGNISSIGERKQVKKSTAMLRAWSSKIFVHLAENWPNLHFQIKLKDSDCYSCEGTVTASHHTAQNSPSTSDLNKTKLKETNSKKERTDEELLIQFDTDIQMLPPEKALSRYMAYLASHGPAAEFGLQRNCDRWGVLERGVIAAPLPVKKNHEVMLRVVEFPVRRTETSHDMVAERDITQSDDSSVKDSSIPLVSLMLPDRLEPLKDVTTEEIEDRTALSVLLYRAFDLSDDFSKQITGAIAKSKLDILPSGSSDRQDISDRESASARLPQSARSNNGMKESARGLLGRTGDSARGGFGAPTMHTVMLPSAVKVVCVITDVPPQNTSSIIPTVTSYDINGRPSVQSIEQPEVVCLSSSSGNSAQAVHNDLSNAGFYLSFEEGSSAFELFEALGKALNASIQPSSSTASLRDREASQGGNRVSTEFRIVVTVTGKYVSATVPAPSKGELSPFTPSSPYGTVQPVRSSEIVPASIPTRYEDRQRNNDSFDAPSCGCTVKSPDIPPVPLISLRTLLKSSKGFTFIEPGKNNILSHKENLKEKARLNMIASEEQRKQDYRSTISSAMRKKVEILFSLTDVTDTVQLIERLISCVVKTAGVLPYHLVEAPKVRRGSLKGGDPGVNGLSVGDGNQHESVISAPSSSSRKLSNPNTRLYEGTQKQAVRPEEDAAQTVVDDTPNGMREANLLTFAFYAPWVKSSQLNASKKEANSIRHKTKVLQERERVEKAQWKRRAEILLFGSHVDPHLSELTLQAGGGLVGMKWLISNIDMDMEKDMDGDLDQDREEYADLLSEMAPSTSPYGSIGSRSFNNNNSHTDRSIGPGKRYSTNRKHTSIGTISSNISSNQSREIGAIPASFPATISGGSAAVGEQGLSINVVRDRDNNKRKGMGVKSTGGLSSRALRTDSLAHVLGIRGNDDRDFSDDTRAKTLRGQDLVSEYSLPSHSDRNLDNRAMCVRKVDIHRSLTKRRSSIGASSDTDPSRESGQGTGNKYSASRQHLHRLGTIM